MDVKLASSDAVLTDRSPAGERRPDLASAGTGADDRSVFVAATAWRAQALRGVGYATGTLTVLWLVALIAGAVGAGRLPAVPFPAIGALGRTPAAHVPRGPARPSLPGGNVGRGPAALGRGTGAGSLRRAAAAPPPASVRGGAPRGGTHRTSGRPGARVPLAGGRRPTASAPSSGSAQPAPGAPQPRSATPSAPSQPAAGGAAKPAAPPGRQTAASKAPATSRAADPPATTPTTARRPATAG